MRTNKQILVIGTPEYKERAMNIKREYDLNIQ